MIAVLMLALAAWGRLHRDAFVRCRWDPIARTYGELRIVAWGGNLSIHSEVAPATATEDTTGVRAKAGPTGTQWTHTGDLLWNNGWRGEPKFVWVNRYRAGPLVGINPRGLARCWTVLCRLDAVGAAFAIAPIVWTGVWIKRRLDRRAGGRRGFTPAMKAG